jgi:lactate permease
MQAGHVRRGLPGAARGGEDGRMLLALQAAPLLLLAVLLVSGRAGAIGAPLVALGAAVLAAAATLPAVSALPGFLVAEALRGAWLAALPVALVAGGLLFQAAAAPPAPDPAPPDARRIFTASVLFGGFAESVMGFGAGAVFALGALKAMGIRGAPLGGLALLSLTLVPWGGFGPGLVVSSALSGVPGAVLSRDTAWLVALWFPSVSVVFWWLCREAGVAVPAWVKLEQLGYLVAVSVLLLLANRGLPFEAAGVFALGPPLLVALWRGQRRRDAGALWDGARVAWPWLVLLGVLVIARLIPDPPRVAPFEGLPYLSATHVAVVLWGVSLAILLLRPGGGVAIGRAFRRAARPALVLLLYVLMARVMAASGAAAELARAAAAVLGPAAPYALPPLGFVSGLVTGSNVASNAALLPVQLGIAEASGLPLRVAAAIHNAAGGLGAGTSFAVMALVAGLLGDGTRPRALWRFLLPMAVPMLAICWVAVAVALG